MLVEVPEDQQPNSVDVASSNANNNNNKIRNTHMSVEAFKLVTLTFYDNDSLPNSKPKLAIEPW